MSGKVKILIRGLNLSKIVDLLIKNEIFIQDLKLANKKITFYIYEKDLEMLDKICKKNHKEYKIVGLSSFKYFKKRLVNYIGFVLAMFINIYLLISFNRYVYSVKLSYSSERNYDLTYVKNILNDNNIKTGALRKDLNEKEIQELIMKNQLDLSGCSVKINGGVIDIILYPSVEKEDRENGDIISMYDARINSVEIYSGTSKVKAGDIVKKGDVLIENQDGASGKIIASIYFNDYEIHNENQLKEVYTGNIIENSNTSFFAINLYKMVNINTFSKYIEEKCVFYPFKNCIIPIKVSKTIYREIRYEEVKIPFFDVEEKLKTKLLEKIKKRINNVFPIKNITYSSVSEDNLTRLDCFVECEIDLCKAT